MRRWFVLVVAVLLPAACGSSTDDAPAVTCPKLDTECPADAPSFSADIQPILDQHCNDCHAEGVPDAPWPLHKYSHVAAWAAEIWSEVEICSMPPPDAGVPFPASDRQKLATWLACGAPNN